MSEPSKATSTQGDVDRLRARVALLEDIIVFADGLARQYADHSLEYLYGADTRERAEIRRILDQAAWKEANERV